MVSKNLKKSMKTKSKQIKQNMKINLKVKLANTTVKPFTMMIHLKNTRFASTAMVISRRLQLLTYFTGICLYFVLLFSSLFIHGGHKRKEKRFRLGHGTIVD